MLDEIEAGIDLTGVLILIRVLAFVSLLLSFVFVSLVSLLVLPSFLLSACESIKHSLALIVPLPLPSFIEPSKTMVVTQR